MQVQAAASTSLAASTSSAWTPTPANDWSPQPDSAADTRLLQAWSAPRQASELDQARTHALLAADVYNDTAQPPAGWRVASADDLRGLGLRPQMLEAGSFRARVYVEGSGADTHYVVAFRGTQSGEDWVQNVRQGLGFASGHYDRAVAIGAALSRTGANVTLTGHSLGGGLASAAAIASGRNADTFNAAGLHDDTIEAAQRTGPRAPDVDAYYVRGEALSLMQDGGDRVLGGIFGGLIGGLVADAPPAYGDRHVLDAVTPDGKTWRNAVNPVDRHGMDWVQSGLAEAR